MWHHHCRYSSYGHVKLPLLMVLKVVSTEEFFIDKMSTLNFSTKAGIDDCIELGCGSHCDGNSRRAVFFKITCF